MTRRKLTSDTDDADLFRSAVGDVKTICNDRYSHVNRRPAAKPRQANVVPECLERDMPDAPCYAAPGFGQNQYFARPGVQKRVLRRLTRGQIPLNAEIDLHGMIVSEARSALAAFLLESLDYQHRCICIIHGKGHSSARQTPVIKGLVDRWLRLNDKVLAFCSAQPQDGGTGAVYVLLKHHRKEHHPESD